jgi:ADP-heptose:LPS heptosyltransferase
MKAIIINPACFKENQDYVLDLQTTQLEGHNPYPYWTAKYIVSKNLALALPEGIFACLTGQMKGLTGSQYNLRHILLQQALPDVMPTKLEGFPPLDELKGKKVLCVLAHATFGLGDLILAMPFLKTFAENLKIKLSVCVNSAGLEYFHEQGWLQKAYPEVLPLHELMQYDYYLEPSLEKMDVLGWIRSYLLKQLGEKVFYDRFPCPELKVIPDQQQKISSSLNTHPKRKLDKKICLFNWEGSSHKRNLSIEVLKAVFRSLLIMDYQILIVKSAYLRSNIFDWLAAQDEVIDVSYLTEGASNLINVVYYADLTVSPDTNLVHLAGGLRKRGLCIFLKSATELYSKTWLKGFYWPGKIGLLYPTLNNLMVPHGSFKDLEKIVYSAVRGAAFGEDPEMIELYNNLFFNLRNQHRYDELEQILKTKNVDFKKLMQKKVKLTEEPLEAEEPISLT